jgi:gliding motility-associated-like protein
MKKLLFTSIVFCLFAFSSKAQLGEWTWFGGDTTGSSALTAGSYGVKGVAATSNWPPQRYQPAYWTDTSGRLWMFGGGNSSLLSNDLWMYDPQANLWTWVNGPQNLSSPNGVWGTKGVPSVNNYPPAKGVGANCWVDKQNNLWLFAGGSYDVTGFIGSGNDLWRYNISTNEWTWMNGSDTISAITPSKGQINVYAASNQPAGVTELKSSWVTDQNIAYFFGGQDDNGFINDTWKYDHSINQFAFVKGGGPASYGTRNVENASNIPPAKSSYTKWKDLNGDFYIFAGFRDSGATNDVWKFRGATNNWTWISGSSQSGFDSAKEIYCTTSKTNGPNARYENQTASAFTCTAFLWTYGGFADYKSGFLFTYNDLWSFNTLTKEWVLASGNSAPIFNAPNFGTKGISSQSNKPPGKAGIGIWNDKKYNTWIFGGYTTFNNATGASRANDLWRYVPDTACLKVPSFTVGGNISAPLIQTICYADTSSTMVDNSIFGLLVLPEQGSSFSDNKLNFSPIITTTYTVIATPIVDCVIGDTIIFTITVLPPLSANFTLQTDVLNLESPIASTTNTSTNAVQYAWYLDSVLVSTEVSPAINAGALGEHCIMLIATNSNGCTDTAINCITVRDIPYLYAPNVFTPNGDDVNDVWHIKSYQVAIQNISIFNRWGQEVFVTKDPSKGWDGTFNKQSVEQDTYFYVIRYKDLLDGFVKTYAGDVMVLR